jgi:hypothetical protein
MHRQVVLPLYYFFGLIRRAVAALLLFSFFFYTALPLATWAKQISLSPSVLTLREKHKHHDQ